MIYYSSLTAMADLLKHGCTTAFDHQYCYTTATGKRPVDRQMEAAAQLGIRYSAGRGGNTLPRKRGAQFLRRWLSLRMNLLRTVNVLLINIMMQVRMR